MKQVIFCLNLFIIYSANSFCAKDCNYDELSKRAEFICDVEWGRKFIWNTDDFLYCSNYAWKIYRETIRIVSILDCEIDEMPDDYLELFTDIRVLNMSSVKLRQLFAADLKYSKRLEQIIVAHNRLSILPANLFGYTAELTSVDFSYNQILRLDPCLFNSLPELTTINFAHNRIESLNERIFDKLTNLEAIDFSHNKIHSIEAQLLANNEKLKMINLRNNPVLHLDCAFLLTLADVSSPIILMNSLTELKTNCANEKAHIEMNVNISSRESSTTLKIDDGNFEWIFNKTDFMKLRNLNFSNSRIDNIPALLTEASTQLISLDLSNTFVGQLNEKTFHKFESLQFLFLSRTNLSNFPFATFYHQRNLRSLSIAYNNLNEIDFHLFVRNFQHLHFLDLEGNNLTQIDSVTRAHFPNLTTLAISGNHFDCAYLVEFLLKWQNLKLIENPSSNQMHIGGVDCYHRISSENQNRTNDSSIPWLIFPTKHHSDGSLRIQTLLIVIISILLAILTVCISLVLCVTLQRGRFWSNTSENMVANYEKNTVNDTPTPNKCCQY